MPGVRTGAPTTVAFQIVPPRSGLVVSVGLLKLARTEPGFGLPLVSARICSSQSGVGEGVTLERIKSSEVRVQD